MAILGFLPENYLFQDIEFYLILIYLIKVITCFVNIERNYIILSYHQCKSKAQKEFFDHQPIF